MAMPDDTAITLPVSVQTRTNSGELDSRNGWTRSVTSTSEDTSCGAVNGPSSKRVAALMRDACILGVQVPALKIGSRFGCTKGPSTV